MTEKEPSGARFAMLAGVYAELYTETKDALIKRGVSQDEAMREAGDGTRSILQTMIKSEDNESDNPWGTP